MRIRTFLAKDMKEALATMRAELGDDAIIVASERLKDGSLCLRAGVETAEQAAPTEAVARGDEPSEVGSVTYAVTFEDRYREELLNRLRAPKPAPADLRSRFDHERLLDLLRAHRTPESIAVSLAEAAESSGLEDMSLALAVALDKVMCAAPTSPVRDKVLLLTGPHGSGKTAVAAKLAAQSRLAGHPVVLVSTDLEAAGQVARLESFAACLDLSVLPVAEPADLARVLKEAHQSQSALIADSAGCDPREPLAPEILRFLAVDGVTPTAVLSAAMDAEEAREMAAAFAQLGAVHLIVTGLDLTRRKGALVALAASGIPIAYVTSSPYLAAGLETLTPLALSRLLTGSTLAPEARGSGMRLAVPGAAQLLRGACLLHVVNAEAARTHADEEQ